MEVTFIVSVSLFLLFISLILVSAINYFTRTPESAVILEVRDKVKNLFNIFFGSGGVITGERATVDLYRIPVLLEEKNGTARTNEIVSLSVDFDEVCNKKTSWNNTVRVYDQQFNELPSKISYQEFCTNQWLNRSTVTFIVNTSANEKKRVYVYSINNSNTSAPSHNLTIKGYWTFDEASGTTAKDFSGYQNNGTLKNFDGTPSSGWYNGTDCIYGNCLKFDGVNDYVNASNSSQLQIKNAITVSVWINATGTASSQRIVTKMSANDGYRLEYNSSGIVRLGVFNGGNGGFGSCGSALTTDRFTSIIATFDGSTVYCYKNGVLAGSNSPSISTIGTSTDNLVIGSTSAGDSLYFNGTLDDLRIYNRSLTIAEIASISNATLLTTTAFPAENITAISAAKLQELAGRNYQEIRTALGGDYDFTVEVREKK